MEEIQNRIKVVLNMLHSDIAWEYQRHKSHTEAKSINSFVSRSDALKNSKEFIQEELNKL